MYSFLSRLPFSILHVGHGSGGVLESHSRAGLDNGALPAAGDAAHAVDERHLRDAAAVAGTAGESVPVATFFATFVRQHTREAEGHGELRSASSIFSAAEIASYERSG